MEATIEFNLPEENREFEITMEAHNLLITLHDLSEWLRDQYKYQGTEKISAEQVRQKLFEFAKDNGVDKILSEY